MFCSRTHLTKVVYVFKWSQCSNATDSRHYYVFLVKYLPEINIFYLYVMFYKSGYLFIFIRKEHAKLFLVDTIEVVV